MYAYRLLDTITYRTHAFLLVKLPALGGQFLLPSKKVRRFKRDDGHLIDIPAQIVSEIEQGLRRPLYRVRMLEQRETACAVSVDVGDDEERPCLSPSRCRLLHRPWFKQGRHIHARQQEV